MAQPAQNQISWHVIQLSQGSRIMPLAFESRNSHDDCGGHFHGMRWGTGRMKGLELPGGARGAAGFRGLAVWLWVLAVLALADPPSAFAIELSPPQAALYTTVSIYPPSAGSMTVCYGFVC